MRHSYVGHKTIRLQHFDYGSHNVYFVTIVTSGRKTSLSRIEGGIVKLSKFGRIIEEEWKVTLGKRLFVGSLHIVIMPDHLHALIALTASEVDDAPD